MKTVLIIHGIGGHAGIHWQKWFGGEAGKLGFKILMPSLPNPDRPDRQTWLSEIRKILGGTDLNELVIAGHSLGVTTALDFLEQSPAAISGLISVAGFAEDYGAELNSYFLAEKPVDFERVNGSLKWAAVIYGDDDPYVPQDSLSKLAASLNVSPFVVEKGGHLNVDSGYGEFPKLLQVFKDYVGVPQQISNAVIKREGKYLLIKEGEGPVRGKWNIPGGHVDAGETPRQAAAREAKEETGYDVRIIKLAHTAKRADRNRTLNAFEAEIIGGEITFPKGEILDARWFTYNEVLALRTELRDADYIIAAIKAVK